MGGTSSVEPGHAVPSTSDAPVDPSHTLPVRSIPSSSQCLESSTNSPLAQETLGGAERLLEAIAGGIVRIQPSKASSLLPGHSCHGQRWNCRGGGYCLMAACRKPFAQFDGSLPEVCLLMHSGTDSQTGPLPNPATSVFLRSLTCEDAEVDDALARLQARLRDRGSCSALDGNSLRRRY